jgi:DNA-binding NarL/FixJ family response regulator
MTIDPIRVLCVDDDLRLCMALQRFLAREPKVHWCGHRAEVEGIGETLVSEHVEVMLLDLSVVTDLAETLAEVRRAAPTVKTIVFSGYHADERSEAALAAGAAEFLSKAVEPEKVLQTILRVGALATVNTTPSASVVKRAGQRS